MRSHAVATQHIADHLVGVPTREHLRAAFIGCEQPFEQCGIELAIHQRGQSLLRGNEIDLFLRPKVQIDLCGIHDEFPEIPYSRGDGQAFNGLPRLFYQRLPV
ncbi:hypothetical protein ACFJGX_11535 [Hydrogenophaga sp. UC242_50]|uniref:hypothetical protein n=1 Tax=Hydrogenophaga sp. UC242_50 TaxID=3350169 RepID=UPI0036D421AA